MTIKAALLTAVSIAFLQASAAGTLHAQGGAPGQAPSANVSDPDVTGSLPAPSAPARDLTGFYNAPTSGDTLAAQGPNPNARELTDIAIYASVGNKQAVAMLASQLRERGVSREAIRNAINGINVHGAAFTAPQPHGLQRRIGESGPVTQ